MKIAQVRAHLAAEGWTMETIPYANAYDRFTKEQIGYKYGNSNQLTAVALHCAYIELWTADPANEPSYQRNQRVLIAFDAAGKVLRTASWADGTGVWSGVSLSQIDDSAMRYGLTGRAVRDAQSAKTAADHNARRDRQERAALLAADATELLSELGHDDVNLSVCHDPSKVAIDLETLLTVLRTANHARGNQ